MILGRTDSQSADQFTALQSLVSSAIPTSELNHELTDHTQIVYTLPYSAQPQYGALFKQLETNLCEYGLTSMGLVSGTLDEVFFKLGGEDTEVYNSSDLVVDMSQYLYPIGSSSSSTSISNENDTSVYQLLERLVSQIKAVAARKIAHAKKDQYTNFLVMPIILFSFLASLIYQALLIPPGLQIPAGNATNTLSSTLSLPVTLSSTLPFVSPYTWIANHQSSYIPSTDVHSFSIDLIPKPLWTFAFTSYNQVRSLQSADGLSGNVTTITDDAVLRLLQNAPPTLLADLVTIMLCYMMFLGIPGVTGEFIVRERVDKLRSLLAVEGCTSLAYWFGTLLGDLFVLSLPLLVSKLYIIHYTEFAI